VKYSKEMVRYAK